MATAILILVMSFGLVHLSSQGICHMENSTSECEYLRGLGCDCGCQTIKSDVKFVVNCTNRGFTDTSMLEDLPSKTQILIFVGNNITQLPWNVFGTNENSYLEEIDMSNNNISEILGKTYHRVDTVERLILNYNNLKISDGEGPNNKHHPRIFSNFINLKELHLTNAFADDSSEDLAEDLYDIFVQSNLSELIKLHLEQNRIRTFKNPQIFCSLPNLLDIYLGNNYLQHIDFSILCLKRLRFIDLEYNKISTLNIMDLMTMDQVARGNHSLMIDLGHNPINCDCNIRNFIDWLTTTKVIVRNNDTLKCENGYPRDNIGSLVKSLKEFQCPPSERYSEMNASGTTISVLIGFLVSLFLLLLGTLLYMNKVHLKYQLSPILDSVSRKVQYTSIGKQDQEMEV